MYAAVAVPGTVRHSTATARPHPIGSVVSIRRTACLPGTAAAPGASGGLTTGDLFPAEDGVKSVAWRDRRLADSPARAVFRPEPVFSRTERPSRSGPHGPDTRRLPGAECSGPAPAPGVSSCGVGAPVCATPAGLSTPFSCPLPHVMWSGPMASCLHVRLSGVINASSAGCRCGNDPA